MLNLIKFDLKNRLKKPMTWFVVIVLCILIGANFQENLKEQSTRNFVEHNVIGVSSELVNTAEHLLDDTEKRAYPIVYESVKTHDQIGLDILDATAKKDYRETSRLTSLWNLVSIKKHKLTMDPISDAMVKNDIYDIWLDVGDGIPYESVDFRPLFSGGRTDTSGYLLPAEYYRDLYINDWEPIYNDEVNNLNAIYSYFFKIIPIMILLAIILFTYNNVNKDKNSGVLKLVLAQSISRGKYYISKWVSCVLHIGTIIFIPPIIMSIVGGFMGGFTSFKYPVFYLKNVFRLVSIPNYFDIVKGEFRTPELYTRVFGHIAPNYPSWGFIPHDDIDTIPFYRYMMIVSILIILFIMFAVAFVQLISLKINNEIISLVTSTGFIGICIYIGLPFTQGKLYNFNPFTFSNVSRIVEGTHNVTVLTSMLIMMLSTGILLAIGYRYFRRKEI